MLALSAVQEVERLLAEGNLTQRGIARRTGISRGTIATIASGKRPQYEKLRAARSEALEEPTGPPERCPECGGMVYMPCRLCRARNAADARGRPSPPPRSFQTPLTLGLELKEEHFLRYQRVRAAREKAEREQPQIEPLAAGQRP